jgi:hypothetical protein
MVKLSATIAITNSTSPPTTITNGRDSCNRKRLDPPLSAMATSFARNEPL